MSEVIDEGIRQHQLTVVGLSPARIDQAVSPPVMVTPGMSRPWRVPARESVQIAKEDVSLVEHPMIVYRMHHRKFWQNLNSSLILSL